MTEIYSISACNETLYIGQTRNSKQRFDKHRADIVAKKHKCKALNKVDVDDCEFTILARVNSESDMIICLVEWLYNSLYKPKNKHVWIGFNSSVTFARCDKEQDRKSVV